ncbi:MAG: hypothetical protein HY046_07600 [Acidobacteria bacterium]|nr:hypothetical protein [Acidobacteriota bacterium]
MLRRSTVPFVFACILWIVNGCMSPAHGQCPTRTSIADTIYNADGSPADGRAMVAWPSFMIGTCQVIAGQATVNIAAGALTIQLYPNDASIPSGTSYRVTYYLKSGRVTTEYWVVPTTTASLPLATIRSATVPVPAVAVSEGQVTNLLTDLAKKIELPSPCPAGRFLQSNGSTSPPQIACVTGGGGGSQHQVNGTNLAANDPINLQDSSTIMVSNVSAGNVQAAVKDASITAPKLSASNPSTVQLSGLGDNNIAAGAVSPNRIAGTAVVQSRIVNTNTPLSGGGALASDLTLTCPTCEITTNRGAASGYAALDSTTKVAQNPASAQTTPAASKILLADTNGKIADGWLSSNVTLLGSQIDLTTEVGGILAGTNGGTGNGFFAITGPATSLKTFTFPNASATILTTNAAVTPAQGGTGASNAATTGRFLRGDGTNFVTSAAAAAGAGACSSNQCITSNNDNASPTCAQPAFSNLSGTATSSQAPHTLLSAFHTDATPASIARGDILGGIGTSPTWQRIAHPGTASRYLKSSATEFGWSNGPASGTGSCTNQFVRSLSDDASPTCATVSLTADVAGTLPGGNGGTNNAFFQVSGPSTSLRTFTFPNASATVLTDNAAVTSTQGGTGSSNTATTGRVLRGNGTNFVTSSSAHAGVGSCTNQFWRAGNDDAVPTCASVAATDFATSASNTHLAGPASTGAAAATPTFRAFDKRDLPTGRYTYVVCHSTNQNIIGESLTVTGTSTFGAPDSTNPHPFCNQATTTTSGSTAGWTSGTALYRNGASLNLQFEAAAKFQETANVRWWIGFTDQTLATMAAADNPAGNYAAFRFSATTDTKYQCTTKDSTTQGVTDSGITADTSAHVFEIVFNDSVPSVVFKIDGNVVCTRTANLPGSVNLGLIIGGSTTTTAARNIRESRLVIRSDK